MKPKVFAETEETVLQDFAQRIIRRSVVTLWRASCPCHRRGEFALVVTHSWREAMDRALEHWRFFHAHP